MPYRNAGITLAAVLLVLIGAVAWLLITPRAGQVDVEAIAGYTFFRPHTRASSSTQSDVERSLISWVANLRADDNVYYAVNSTTSDTTRTSSRYGVFNGVSKALTTLRVIYKDKLSRPCTQTVDIWNWSNSTSLTLNPATIGTTVVLLANLS